MVTLTFAAGLIVCGGDVADKKTGPRPDDAGDVFPLRLDTRDSQGRSKAERIEPGDATIAKAYLERIAPDLGLTKPPANLDELLQHFGFQHLSAENLDRLPSVTLMNFEQLKAELGAAADGEFAAAPAAWDVLAAGYFAPKTADVSGGSNKISWRKVVRVKPRLGSGAAQAGLTSLYFLSVIYVLPADLQAGKQSPFEFPSQNVQVLLTRDPKTARLSQKDPVYFLAFDPTQKFQITDHTTTSWDAYDHSTPGITPIGERNYFVPTACIQCHGGEESGGGGAHRFATLHYFDTDYSLDKASPGEDFEQSVGVSPWSALMDAGKNFNSEQHHAAFDVFRHLNQEIASHNRAVSSTSRNTCGAENWLRLHESTAIHIPPIRRAFLTKAKPQWTEADDLDRQLVPLLNRYCYRCHSTLFFNVLDRESLFGEGQNGPIIDNMIRYVAERYMPQDRAKLSSQQDLVKRDHEDKEVRARLVELLKKLRATRPAPSN